MVNAVNKETFAAEVLGADKPVLVDFWAPWCGPCRAVGPVLEELSGDFEGRATVVKVNVDDEPELAAQYGVRSIPTLLVIDQGQVKQTLVGAQPKAPLTEALEREIRASAA